MFIKIVTQVQIFGALGMLILATQGHAATVSASGVTNSGICGFGEIGLSSDGVTSVQGGCAGAIDVPYSIATGIARARASFGSVGVEVRASTIQVPSEVFGAVQSSAVAIAEFSDTLKFSISEGVLRLPIEVAGTVLTSLNGINAQFPARLGVDLQVIADFAQYFSLYEYYFNNPETPIIGGEIGVNFVDVAFVNGSVGLQVRMSALAECYSGRAVGDSCSSQAAFFNSARLLGATVFDLNGVVVDNGFLSSESGFDYARGLQPHQPSPVPLPFSGLMGLAGIAALLSFSWVTKTKPLVA
jgi:hypothetical protein